MIRIGFPSFMIDTEIPSFDFLHMDPFMYLFVTVDQSLRLILQMEKIIQMMKLIQKVISRMVAVLDS